MKPVLQKKAAGFYLLLAAAVAALVALVWFLTWAPASGNMDTAVVAFLLLGIALCVVLFFKDSNLLMVFSTICYSIPTVRLFTNSVGSFVDKFQGINMFGNAAQVDTITAMGAVMLVSVLLCIVASFLKREK